MTSPAATTIRDEVGNDVHVGDIWVATCVNANRGVGHWLFQARCPVVAVKRTRVVIDTRAAGIDGTAAVGAECGRVLAAGDGRTLRTWNDVHAERLAALLRRILLTNPPEVPS